MKKKNILLIVTDQHRIDTLLCYNKDTLCKTPNIDEIAKNSLVFNNAYTTCPVCSPARSSLFSGFYPSKTGMETNIYCTGCRTHEFQDGEHILSRRLQNLGYNLGYTGKWHLGVNVLPTDLGFEGDDFPGHGDGGWNYPQYKKYLKDNKLELKMDNIGKRDRPGDHSRWGEVVSPIETTIEYYLAQRTIDIIDGFKDKEKPFFFALNFWGPHEPFFAPTKFLDMYKNAIIPENPSFSEDAKTMPKIYDLLRRPELDWEFFQNTLRHYYACITHLDSEIGRIVQHLKEKGVYDDTSIIFTADHGDNQGCHGGLENKSYSMYDDTTNIPLFIKPAQASFNGYTQTAFASTCDIYASILDIAGYVPNDKLGFCDGRPLTRFIDDKSTKGWANDIVTQGMGAFDVITTQRMYRQDNWKYVFNGAGEDQLFNLNTDPYEMQNLIDLPQHKTTLLKLKIDFARWMSEHGDVVRDSFCKLNRIEEWEVK